MPYNLTPITPTEEITGTVSLPLARVKKIIHADEDISACSNNAAFAIAVATELFIKHLAEQSYNVVRAEKKPRKNIQYRDVATAVARVDNLEFLADVVPKTTTYREFKQRQKGGRSGEVVNGLGGGQRTMEEMTRGGRADLQGMEDGHIYDTQQRESRMSGQQVHAPHTNGHAYEDEEGEQASMSPEPAHAQDPNRGAAALARHDYDAVHDTAIVQDQAMED